MDFGDVLRSMKENPDRMFAREGWNGKGMYIFYTPSHYVPVSEWKGKIPKDCVIKKINLDTSETEDVVAIEGHIDMKSAVNTLVIGWLASQTDMVAEDWEEVF